MKKILFNILIAVFLLGCKSKDDHTGHDHAGTKVYYTCSMDPQVLETKPGKCPICHMDLTPITLDQMQSNGLKISEEQVRLANIKTKKVVLGYIDQQIFATGVVKENENNIHFLNARVDGRLDKLNFKTKGAVVSKGQVLYEIYSEMLAGTQSEFINNWKLLSQNPKDRLLLSIHQTTSNKLMLWGLSEGQIEQLKTRDRPVIPYPILSPVSGIIKALRVSEGSTVMEGQALIELTEYKSLWVDAQFYADETAHIHSGSVLDVFVQGASGSAIKGKVVQVLPQVAPSSTVNIVRILINSSDSSVRPGMQADIAWHKEGEKSMIVPSNAVLREAVGNTVWVKNKDDVYEPKMVHIGEVSGSKVEILHGLEVGDEVVYSGAYLLQSEYIFKKGNNPMAGHEM